MTTSFGARLAAAVDLQGPLCVGIDPHPSMLTYWGLSVDASGLERCARTMVEAAAGQVALVKPQSAFFEAFGSAGIAVLERVLSDCRDAGLLSLLDIKRGDIGSTMDAYAAAYLSDGSSLAADAVTLSPYLGVGSLDGALARAAQTGRGVFLLAATSNPEAGEFQRARTESDDVVAQRVIDAAGAANAASSADSANAMNAMNAMNAGSAGSAGSWGSVGVVVGATIEPATASLLDFSYLRGPVLVPGFGAQGGTVDDLDRVLGPARRYALPTSSRAVMAAGPDLADLRAEVAHTSRAVSATLTRN